MAKPRARPIDYSVELADAILTRIAAGETLSKICKEEDMPHRRTVLRWKDNDPEFEKLYRRARTEAMHALADEIVEIADNEEGDVQRDKLKIDTRTFLMRRIEPSTYGDKQEHTGPGGGPLQTEDVNLRDLARRIAFLLQASGGPDDDAP
jgi:hypothetical protein